MLNLILLVIAFSITSSIAEPIELIKDDEATISYLNSVHSTSRHQTQGFWAESFKKRVSEWTAK